MRFIKNVLNIISKHKVKFNLKARMSNFLLDLPVCDLLDLGQVGLDVLSQGQAPLHLTAGLASKQRL